MSAGKPWPHWPQDTEVTEGVWRDYHTGTELDDFPKPWKKPHDDLRGEGSDCLFLYTWWPEKGHVIQFDTSWWEGDCTAAWKGWTVIYLILETINCNYYRLSLQERAASSSDLPQRGLSLLQYQDQECSCGAPVHPCTEARQFERCLVQGRPFLQNQTGRKMDDYRRRF